MLIISTKVLESGSNDANKALKLLLHTFVQYVCKDTKMHCVIQLLLFSTALSTFFSKKSINIPFCEPKISLAEPFLFNHK